MVYSGFLFIPSNVRKTKIYLIQTTPLQERNRDYVIQLEMYLSKALNADGTRDEDDAELM